MDTITSCNCSNVQYSSRRLQNRAKALKILSPWPLLLRPIWHSDTHHETYEANFQASVQQGNTELFVCSWLSASAFRASPWHRLDPQSQAWSDCMT